MYVYMRLLPLHKYGSLTINDPERVSYSIFSSFFIIPLKNFPRKHEHQKCQKTIEKFHMSKRQSISAVFYAEPQLGPGQPLSCVISHVAERADMARNR